MRGPCRNEVDMELDKQQIKRLRERHHRRHGIRPAHSEAMENAARFLKQAFNIREGRAPYHVIRKRFVNGARLTGSHLCILIIAMLIASIGLDIDSDIAIVGAMLICPLMGSVLAMAYGIATLDREITVEAVAGLALQMAFCLVTSTLYFKLSPLGTTTAAIIDNSTPTVWDLAVALAGGFAGGLGNSRDQEPATLIAGVAVATALMPPRAQRATASPSRAGGSSPRHSTNLASTWSLSRWRPKLCCFFCVCRSSATSTATAS